MWKHTPWIETVPLSDLAESSELDANRVDGRDAGIESAALGLSLSLSLKHDPEDRRFFIPVCRLLRGIAGAYHQNSIHQDAAIARIVFSIFGKPISLGGFVPCGYSRQRDTAQALLFCETANAGRKQHPGVQTAIEAFGFRFYFMSYRQR